jgi:hypothetical protein
LLGTGRRRVVCPGWGRKHGQDGDRH